MLTVLTRCERLSRGFLLRLLEHILKHNLSVNARASGPCNNKPGAPLVRRMATPRIHDYHADFDGSNPLLSSPLADITIRRGYYPPASFHDRAPKPVSSPLVVA
jgi:hypothetical protein